MIEWFFLYRVDAEAAGAAISRQNEFIPGPGADKTKPPLPLMKTAKSGTQVTLQPAIVKQVPKAAGSAVDPFISRYSCVLLSHINRVGVIGHPLNDIGTILKVK